MDYWADTMQDDCYLIAADGWVAETHRVFKENNKGEMKDKGWACDLIPKPYILARYFSKEQSELDDLQAQLEAIDSSLAELSEEHGGEEDVLKDVSTKGDAQVAYTQTLTASWNEDDKAACARYVSLLSDAEEHALTLRTLTDHTHLSTLKNSKGKVTLKAINQRLTETGDRSEQATLNKYLDTDKEQKARSREADKLLGKVELQYKDRLTEKPLPEELADLYITVSYLNLLDEQKAMKAKFKETDEALDKLAHDKYPQLSVDEIKTIVVEDKWIASLAVSVNREINNISQMLTGRIRQLAERYETPLPHLVSSVADLSGRVNEHLKRMGAKWE